MTKLFTTVKSPKPKFSINIGASYISIGSCFADEIPRYLNKYKFSGIANPFGSLYNPISIADTLVNISKNNYTIIDELYTENNRFYCLKYSSYFSSNNKAELIARINKCEKHLYNRLKKTNLLIITLGTSYYYKLKESQKPIGNCHKLSQNIFSRELLTYDEIVKNLNLAINSIYQINRDIKIIFTVSPIRHLRDSAPDNSRSKGLLLSATQEVIENKNSCYYFPSYEIMIDELRDYRYYKDDLIHPSSLALDIIWQRFSEAVLSKDSNKFNKLYENIYNGLNHKPGNNRETNTLFAKSMIKKIDLMSNNYSGLNFSNETEYFINIIESNSNE